MQNRTYKLLQGRPAPSSFAWAEHWNPLRTGGLADIEEWLEEHSTAHCVVIDTLEQTEMNGEQASLFTTDEYSHMLPLKVIADTYHIALVLLHHLNKYEVNDLNDRNGGRSTSDLFNMVDCSMFLTREPGQTDAMLHISGQSMEDQQLALCFEPASAQWKLKGVLQ